MHEGKCPTITFPFESYIQMKIWSEYKSLVLIFSYG